MADPAPLAPAAPVSRLKSLGTVVLGTIVFGAVVGIASDPSKPVARAMPAR
jgi:hypothetical protein